ncbi:MAG: NADP-dependent malic enzyme [Candidatus Cloacimonadaceae bacterium]|jgi:malate dehydrogenase (oxaloacetate-decarboxylating)|nr:NADP-dependent malic enzyme [Candidatus Cloacimonadota bacterium]MDX9949143.1 NADP-dependent malic enzyme [Candidatus Syntrophosphaera sp.]
MDKLKSDLSNLQQYFAANFPPEKRAAAQTAFLKNLSELAHAHFQGKMQTLPKAGIWDFNWFNVWYTPGVSSVSTAIRDDQTRSFELSNRGNLVAVVSDSTRVLGDGDCGPAGGLGVMEGKAMLMKYLGGCDALALCVNNRDSQGKPDPQRLIEFVKMLEPSVGAVNLEDISQPNCYRVLDELRASCNIPVWHDDAQGTACVTLAGLLNALELVGKKMENIRTVLFGAGASNSTIASILLQSGLDPKNLVMFDSKGGLHSGRKDLATNPDKFKQWNLAQISNPKRFETMEEAMPGADVLISLSRPGPGTVKPEWIRLMAPRAIVFACANPVPEIYPHEAKAAGAYIVATGRGDFPNQINNSLGFPGILKGSLLARASRITDGMAIRAAHSLAGFARQRGIDPENIIPRMDETGVFAQEAADVAMQAIKEGVARQALTRDEVFAQAEADIQAARSICHKMMDDGSIAPPPAELIQKALEYTRAQNPD